MSSCFSMREKIFCTVDTWRSSVVRMKSSFEISIAFQREVKVLATSSTKAWGVTPLASAFFSIFWPCSSRPVTKKTSYPLSLFPRAITSHMVVQ